jgi:hypothetical protein
MSAVLLFYDTVTVPEVTSVAATGVSSGIATLHGTVDPNGFASVAGFKWGTVSGNLTNSTAATESPTSSKKIITTSVSLTGLLTDGSTYYFQAYDSSSRGLALGSELSFIPDGTMDYYDTVGTRDGSRTLAGNSFPYTGQTFTGNGEKIDLIYVYEYKQGSPTGYTKLKLYTTNGTYGSTSVRNNSDLLATSDSVASADQVAGWRWVCYKFSEPYTTTNGTHYAFSPLTYSDAQPTSCMRIGYDASSPTHSGNYYEGYEASVSAAADKDMVFKIYGSPP